MSFVVAAPEMVQTAAQDLAGIRSALVEALSTVATPTTGVMPAAADGVSAAIAATFGDFGQEFQALSAQAQAFHAEFVGLMNAGAGAYAGTEIANAEQVLAGMISAPAQAVLGNPLIGGISSVAGSAAAAGATPAASGLLGGLLGGTGTGGLLGGVGGLTGTGGLLGGLLGGLTGTGGVLGGILGGLTGGTGGLGGIVGGLGSLGTDLNSLVSGALPGVPGLLTGVEKTLTGLTNSLLPGLLHINIGDTGPYFTGIAGPYEELVYNTWHNLQSLGATWLADPFPFLRQFIANQISYGHTIATAFGNAAQSIATQAAGLPTAFQAASQAFAAGNYAGGLGDLETAAQNVFSGVPGSLSPIAAIPGHIAQNAANVVQTLTNTSITPTLDLSLLPASLTLDNAVGLPIVLGLALLGPPAAALQAAGSSASAFTAAMQAGNPGGAIAALIDAPAVIANGFLNGQATYPYVLSLSNLTAPLGLNLGSVVNVSATENLPLDGLLVPPGYYAATVTVTSALDPLLPPITVDIGVGGTPFSGLLPFLINYAPEQLAQAIGAPASPPPLISVPL